MNLIIPAKLRPTTSKLKEAIFNILYSELGEKEYKELEFLDVFAGSGQVGIEALKKNFKSVVFLEKSALHLKIIEKNLQKNKIAPERFSLLKRDVLISSKLFPSKSKFKVIFLDPPYSLEKTKIFNLLEKIQLYQKQNSQKNTLFLLERKFSAEEESFWEKKQKKFTLQKAKRYGSSILFIFRDALVFN